MTARELKDKFIKFFLSKEHVEIPSCNLIPENDSTTLFISAGMQPLVPYFTDQVHPLGKRLVNLQKCVRTGDIEEVGDDCHHTFFEMLGNWSLGDYFKKETISFSYDFLINVLNIDPQNLAISVFSGNKNSPKDTESYDFWISQGIDKNRIAFLDDNWWGPAGTTGPCGPDSEIFYWTGEGKAPSKFDTNDKRWLEIWNDVFLQYDKKNDTTFKPLSQTNVDTGMGVERTLAALSGLSDNYLSSIWQPIIKVVEKLCDMVYGDKSDQDYIKEGKQCWVDIRKSMRIIADHIRSAVFIIADGVEPSNKEAGYVLRRLIRRSVRQGKIIGIENNFLIKVAQAVLDNQSNYAGTYPELNQNKDRIFSILESEENRFRKTLNRGLNEINKLIKTHKKLSGRQAFTLYESFGFPVEMIQEELQKNNLTLDLEKFNQAKKEHAQKSKTLSAGKFKSGLADNSEIIIQYHTATHLLHASLRKILGNHVQQSGSNITDNRLRFDFTHPEKMTADQIKKVEDLINQQIENKLSITKESKSFVDAQKSGALAFFTGKYPETVTVFTVGDFSKEICTGPHLENTDKLPLIKINKEESAGSGKRRLYASFK